jgi:hypothetical protein
VCDDGVVTLLYITYSIHYPPHPYTTREPYHHPEAMTLSSLRSLGAWRTNARTHASADGKYLIETSYGLIGSSSRVFIRDLYRRGKIGAQQVSREIGLVTEFINLENRELGMKAALGRSVAEMRMQV